ncbi:MAG: YadA-like family protein, partial [Veillonella sp.]|nr:YadA-like family protein [Veillonella sp.]
YIAGDNIHLEQDGRNITVATNPEVTFKSVTASTVNAKDVNAENVTAENATISTVLANKVTAKEGYISTVFATDVTAKNGYISTVTAQDVIASTATFTDSKGNKTSVTGNGIVITPAQAGASTVQLTDKGLDNGGNKIVNVAAGEVSSTSTDAVNGSQLYSTAQSTASAITNLANSTATEIGKGWNVASNSTGTGTLTSTAASGKVSMGDTVTYIAGDNIHLTQDGQKITVATNPEVTFKSVTASTVNAKNVTAETVKANDVVAKNGYISSVVAHDVTAVEGNISTVNANTVNANTVNAVEGNISTVNANSVVASTATLTDKDGNTTSITGNGMTITPADSSKSTVKLTTDGLDNGGNKIVNVAKGDVSATSTDAINGSQLYSTAQSTASAITNLATSTTGAIDNLAKSTGDAIQANSTAIKANADQIAKGWNLEADKTGSGTVSTSGKANVAMGETVKYTAGDNISIVQDGKHITIATNPDVTFSTVTASTVSASSATFSTVTVGDVKIDAQGIDAGNKVISNVAAGVKDTDAVNVSQLKASTSAAKTEVQSSATIAVTSSTAGDGHTIYTVAASTVGITANADGSVKAGDSTSLATAQTVADAINKAGWTVTSGQEGSGHAYSTTKELINPGETVTLKAGDNLVLKQNGNDFTYSLNKDVDLGKDGSLTIGSTALNATSVTTNNVVASTATLSTVNAVEGNISTVNAKTGNIETVNAKTVNTNDLLASTAQIKNLSASTAAFSSVQVGPVKITETDGINAGNTQIKDVKAGDVSATSTHAINGSQLYNTASTVANALGGGSTVDKDGKVTDPSYTITSADGSTSTVVNNVGDALTNLNQEVQKPLTFAGNAGDDVSRNLGTTLKVVGEEGDAVTATAAGNIKVTGNAKDNSLTIGLNKDLNLTDKGSITTGDTVMNNAGITMGSTAASAGTTYTKDGVSIANGPSLTAKDGLSVGGVTIANEKDKDGYTQIKGVANGKDPHDAVNVSQLDGAVTNINNQMGKLNDKISDTGALGAALAALKPIQYDPLEPTQIMAGVGSYDGSTALALGLAHYKNESTMFHAGVSYSGREGNKVMANAGVTWKVGSRADETAIADQYRQGPISSAYALQDRMNAMAEQNNKLVEQNAELAAKSDKLEAMVAELVKEVQELKAKA